MLASNIDEELVVNSSLHEVFHWTLCIRLRSAASDACNRGFLYYNVNFLRCKDEPTDRLYNDTRLIVQTNDKPFVASDIISSKTP